MLKYLSIETELLHYYITSLIHFHSSLYIFLRVLTALASKFFPALAPRLKIVDLPFKKILRV